MEEKVISIQREFQQDHLYLMEEGLKRYVQPFKFLFGGAYWVLARLPFIPLLPIELAYRIRLGLTDVINFFSNGEYETRILNLHTQLPRGNYTDPAAQEIVNKTINWHGLLQLLSIGYALHSFIVPKASSKLWELISFMTLPLRVILALILLPVSIIVIFIEQLLRRLLTPANYLLRILNLPVQFLSLLVLNFPRYPNSILLVAAAIGFTIATFGIAPIMLAIAAGIGMLSSMIIFEKKLSFLDNSYIEWGLVVLIFIAAAAAVVFSAGTSLAIAAVLPFALPQIALPSAIALKALIAAGVGLATTAISTIMIPGAIKVLVNLKDCCIPEDDDSPSMPPPQDKSDSDAAESSGSSNDSAPESSTTNTEERADRPAANPPHSSSSESTDQGSLIYRR
jgi:hypothetical protein